MMGSKNSIKESIWSGLSPLERLVWDRLSLARNLIVDVKIQHNGRDEYELQFFLSNGTRWVLNINNETRPPRWIVQLPREGPVHEHQ
jgi:hypothetical protein